MTWKDFWAVPSSPSHPSPFLHYYMYNRTSLAHRDLPESLPSIDINTAMLEKTFFLTQPRNTEVLLDSTKEY